jgi:hypothetical protein
LGRFWGALRGSQGESGGKRGAKREWKGGCDGIKRGRNDEDEMRIKTKIED